MQVIHVAPDTKHKLNTEECQQHTSVHTQGLKLRGRYGFGYILISLGINIWYLSILTPLTKNDLWWSNFNSTGVQTYLADLVNSRLASQSHDSFDLFDNSIGKDYSQSNTQINFWFPSYRRALFDSLSFESVILAMRNNTMSDKFQMGQAFCWVDFDRQFEMAHTATRQKRCMKWNTNAAMYLESLLRNVMTNDTSVVHDDLTTLDIPWYDVMAWTVFNPMKTMPNGLQWAEYIVAHSALPVREEAAYWRQHGLSHWRNLVKNLKQVTFDDTIDILNSLGSVQRFTINRNPLEASHSTNQDSTTSKKLYMGFTYDLNTCINPNYPYNCSVVRNNAQSVEALGFDWDVIYYKQTTSGSNILRTSIGPLGSIDANSVNIPQQLSKLYHKFLSDLTRTLTHDATFWTLYRSIIESEVDPLPASWRGISSYGGSPLCPHGTIQTFIQSSFHWGDDCSVPRQFKVKLTANSVLFAMMMTNLSAITIQPICSFTSSTRSNCETTLESALPLQKIFSTSQLESLQNEAKISIVSLNVSVMQLALVNSSKKLLVLPIVDEREAEWSFYGYVTFFQWLEGKREVYSFEGDNGTVVLMSDYQEYYSIEANALELPQVACAYIAFVSYYTSLILVLVGIVVFTFGFITRRGPIESYNLFQFNRVVGSVWVGRPLLAIRGLTAIVLLSMSSVEFQSQNGHTRLIKSPRNILDAAVIAGEATWFSYAIQDFFLPVTNPYASISSPLSIITMWIAMIVFEMVNPFEATIALNRLCTASLLGHSASCTNGTLEFGSFTRLFWLCCGQLIISFVAFGIVRLFWSKLPHGIVHHQLDQHVMIPASAQTFFIQNYGDELKLDTVASIFCGILPYHGRLFDVKLWVFAQKARREGTQWIFKSASFNVGLSESMHSGVKYRRKLSMGLSLLGLAYVAASVTGSYYFLRRIDSIMANDSGGLISTLLAILLSLQTILPTTLKLEPA